MVPATLHSSDLRALPAAGGQETTDGLIANHSLQPQEVGLAQRCHRQVWSRTECRRSAGGLGLPADWAHFVHPVTFPDPCPHEFNCSPRRH
jgi:hypothetical protein